MLKGQQQLTAEIQKGIDELDAGQGIDGEIVVKQLRERARKAMAKRCSKDKAVALHHREVQTVHRHHCHTHTE